MQTEIISTNLIDSLNLKISTLEESIKQLQASQYELTIQSHEALARSGFFSDQLAFQLWSFAAILIILSLINWGTLYNPINKKLNKITSKIIPNFEKNILETQDKFKIEVDKDIHKIAREAFLANSWSLRSFVSYFELIKDYNYTFLFSMRAANLALKNPNLIYNGNPEQIITSWQESSYNYLNQAAFNKDFVIDNKQEIEIMCKLMLNSEINGVGENGKKLYLLFVEKSENKV